MARTPNTTHDPDIKKLLKGGNSVTQIAKTLNLSDPTVYKAIRRLGLTLPGRTDTPSKATPRPAPAPKAAGAAGRTPKKSAVSDDKTADTSAPSKPTTPKTVASARPTRSARKPAPTTRVQTSTPTESGTVAEPSVALVRIAVDDSLLTVRVEKGIELLKNLSARIVRHERELAAARQRYADTLAALALD
jgi:hypothetical protein